MRKLLAICAALSLGATAACTVHQDDAPTPSGPSTNAISVTVTATPDTLPQNGTAQSTIRMKAFNAGGQPLPNLQLRLELQLNGVTRDFGTLSVRNVITGADGTASAIYTAPSGTNAGGLGTTVAVVATPVSGDAANQGILNSVGAVSQAYVRLVADGLTNPPPPETPTAAFSTAGSLTAGAVVLFNGTTSTSGGTSTLTNWDWDFGDNTAHASGSVVTHAFATARPYGVTLTVTNSQGRSASTVSVVTIGAGTGPTALFTALPNPVAVNGTVTLDATASTGNPQIVNYKWTVTAPGGAQTVSGGSSPTASFVANAAGTWTISLTVTDSNGRSSAATTNTVLAQ